MLVALSSHAVTSIRTGVRHYSAPGKYLEVNGIESLPGAGYVHDSCSGLDSRLIAGHASRQYRTWSRLLASLPAEFEYFPLSQYKLGCRSERILQVKLTAPSTNTVAFRGGCVIMGRWFRRSAKTKAGPPPVKALLHHRPRC